MIRFRQMTDLRALNGMAEEIEELKNEIEAKFVTVEVKMISIFMLIFFPFFFI